MFESEPALAWAAMPYRAKVYGADGTEIGTAESLLGDESADIFHGIALRKASGGRTLEVPAAHIQKITEHGVATDLDAAGVAGLEPYREERWYHLGWGGLFRKHPKWDETSNP